MNERIKIILISTIILILLISNFNSVSGRSFEEKSKNFFGKNNDLFDELLFDLKIKTLMRKSHVPSLSVGIVKNDSLVWYKGYGYSKTLLRQKPTKDTVYQAGSISKCVTATAMMQLYEKGLYDLDDDVNDYLDFELRNPNYPEVPITFRMLLAHQASFEEWSTKQGLYLTLTTQLSILNYPYPLIKEILLTNGSLYRAASWNDYPPGAKCNYSNINYIVLEHLVERLTNQSYEEYCQKNIFDPLNMNNTSFFYSDLKRSQFANPYSHIGRFYVRQPLIDYLSGVGGMKTSVEDLSHFLIAHMNGGLYKDTRILNETTVELMHTIQYPNCSWYGCKLGLGWIEGYEEITGDIYRGHGGEVAGGTSQMFINGTGEYAYIYFLNRMFITYTQRESDAFTTIWTMINEKGKEMC